MFRRWVLRIVAGLSLLYLGLLIPDCEHAPGAAGAQQPFEWRRDAFWSALEQRFVAVRKQGCPAATPGIRQQAGAMDQLLSQLDQHTLSASDPRLDQLEQQLFQLAASVAACPEHLALLANRTSAIRKHIKQQSIQWKMSSAKVRQRLYRLLYGSRAALEEVLLQAPQAAAKVPIKLLDEPSATPSTQVQGVQIHSGDLLLSRGGAPTSALIARGNDFPGNFSHVALVHVDAKSGEATVVEAHIERGVALASPEDYFRDKKLRILVLRPRADHPLLKKDPLLPHRAAEQTIQRARRQHIPYDFAMNFDDPSALFCSEVASAAYRSQGMRLWMGISQISSPVLRQWLAGFGVRHFTTQSPSDLEYDPALRVVAEWRDPEVLYDDHLDNAVIDASVELAKEPRPLPHAWYILPWARILKAYSTIKNLWGGIGPIPEGMSATSALRNRAFSLRHAVIRKELRQRALAFEKRQGYRPPYWALVGLARQVISNQAQ